MKYSHSKAISNQPLMQSIMLGLGVLAAIALLVWFGVEQWYQTSLEPKADQAEEVIFAVTPGMSTLEIASQLEQQDLIRSATAFVWYLNRQGDMVALQAGTYRLSATFSTPEIADKLIDGDIDHSLITIPPGLRLDELAEKVFQRHGFKPDTIEEAFKFRYDDPILADKPSGASLEGYIFPETFQIKDGSTPREVIQRSLDEFSSRFTPAIRQGIERQGLSLHEAITLASIIQLEDERPEVQRQIAQVFLSRLSREMPLGADPTFRYAAAVEGGQAGPSNPSRYNTYRHAGLPPGPIANFNLSALEAVANPDNTDYLYFVHGDDCIEDDSSKCTIYFAKTESEHEANVSRYCRRNCSL